ncbi:aminotransferase class V-fold PLP-dependent enzyme [Rhodoferax sp. PAMC 29310]|uniref:aminotransferase class V-fold PLP-dependent enzyme n=1 Tax=Rhodoferax sp. PAMC 29310 TaxID=2822760 RepID=UPI001B32D2C8|nr:aminotransferase class V-fold PLP-dependent enzyme [Rhodoferax sp. PAMC 29310]
MLLEGLRQSVAGALDSAPDEVVLTRGATESMLALISGYRHLKRGDTVLYCDLDYPAMRHAIEWLRERRGVTPVRLSLPEPATRDAVMETYARALRDHPGTKLVLLTHLSHSTGLVLPLAELADLARAAGAEVILGAPLGCGCLYIRRGHVTSIDRYFGDRDFTDSDIRARIHTGSPNFVAWLTLPAALQLHQRIGVQAKAARLLHLRNYWVNQVCALAHIEVLTPDDPRSVAGITSFRVKGQTSAVDNDAIVATLRDQHDVFTVRRDGPSAGDGVRVTPAITTTHADLDRLMGGVRALPA